MVGFSDSLYFFFFPVKNAWACRERATGLTVDLACRGLLCNFFFFFFQILVQFFLGFFFCLKVEQIIFIFIFIFI